ncbi:MAG: ATP-grasp domain-containing protein [Bacteroides thetaiotaomicron]|nr:ATP-grasp domain-containing protein [Bacteroides thetaiotaomicron]
MQKRLLVLAAGILQVPVIKKAKDMGIYVIAADGDANAVGLQYADKAVVVNITSEEDVLRVAREERIDGVIHPCSEVSMNVMGRINDELGLAGITREQAIRATNKHLMREAFEKGNAPSPKSILTESAEDAWKHLQNDFTTDGILKPSRNSGSRGIAKVTRDMPKEEFEKAYYIALEESRDKSVLIEQFIEGPEFSIEIIVWNGKVNVLTVTDKKTTEAPHFVELGHNQPSCRTAEEVETLKVAAVAGVKALGVNNCACHAEAKLSQQVNKSTGQIETVAYLMEIGARLGGDFISTELTHLSTGIDMVAAAVDVALGIEPDLSVKEQPKGACIRYFCPKPGKLVSISNLEALDDPRVYKKKIYVQVGDMIPEVTSSLCRSGHVIVTEETPQKAIALAEKLITDVKMETE